MDVVTELSARAAAYIGVLQDALALVKPGTPGLKAYDPVFEGPLVLELDTKLLSQEQVIPTGQVWQKFYGNARLLAGALELSAPEKNLLQYKYKPGKEFPQELQEGLELFARQAQQLLEKVLLPHKGFLVNKLAERMAVADAAGEKGVGEGAGNYYQNKFLPPEPWRRAIRSLLYEAPETAVVYEASKTDEDYHPRIALVKALGSNGYPYEPLLLRKAREVLKHKQELNNALLLLNNELESCDPLTSRLKNKEAEGDDHFSQLLARKALLLDYLKVDLPDPFQWDGRGQLHQLDKALLVDDRVRDEVLRLGGCALPFEVVFRQEQEEITRRRRKLAGNPDLVAGGSSANQATRTPGDSPPGTGDAPQEAARLGLCGLAFSGGGIRSATFNLGLLQGLACRGWLPHFDYLSTVSGGSYLGSWLTAWIKRAGSLHKVVARLNPNYSSEPRAEEVRPIRWLRMYSNYLAPHPSLLSTDSWTLGMTWLRNALLNQIIMVLTLGAVLALGIALLEQWQSLQWQKSPQVWWVVFPVLLFLGAGLSGLGMSMFRSSHTWPSKFKVQLLVGITVMLSLVAAFLVSGLLYNQAYPGFGKAYSTLQILVPAGALALLLVALLGRYDRCFYGLEDHPKPTVGHLMLAWGTITVVSLAAAALGLAALVLAWNALAGFHQAVPAAGPKGETMFPPLHVAFVVALPLVLEVLVVTVVMRMALLGRNFPDERREWWGRMGAVMHLAAVAWLVLTGSILLSRPVFFMVREYVAAQIVATGWAALVISAVRLAYKSSSPAQPDKAGASSWLGKITSLGPYAFGLGLLLITAATVENLMHWLSLKLPLWEGRLIPRVAVALCLAGVLGLLAFLLSWRVEVNEFSLHHFYRNRLRRAYLGASRRRTERNQTADSFTSFDRRDDIKMCSLRQDDPLAPEQDYDGPYLIINATLNTTQVTDLAQQDRKAESFVFTPHYCGFDFGRVRAINPKRASFDFDFGYRPTQRYAYPQENGPALGTAMTISGAATNPNRGYHSSPASAFMLALFNARLGWWMGNPSREDTWKTASPRVGFLYLLSELFGRSNTTNRYVNLSDGGHFDNMGLYELVRRRCRYIVLGDAEEDHRFTCEGLANAIRRCRVDFGVEITIDVTRITNRQDKISPHHYALGTIYYPDDLPGTPPGYLLYLKSSLTGTEPADVREYAVKNEAFPHQSTQDQFFDESQFESYRRLGLHVAEKVLPHLDHWQDVEVAFRQLDDRQRSEDHRDHLPEPVYGPAPDRDLLSGPQPGLAAKPRAAQLANEKY